MALKKLFARQQNAAALLFAAAFLAFAALPLRAEPLGQAAPSLERVAELLAKHKVTRGQFVLERMSANGKALKSSGDFVIAADYGIIWKTEKPIKAAQVVAREWTLTESAGGKRVKMDASKNPVYKQMAVLTSALWTGDLQAVQSAADLNFWSDEKSWRIEMFPKDQAIQMALEKIIVEGTCGGGTAAATKMQMFLKGGNSAAYVMSGHAFSDTLSASERAYFD